MAKGNNTWEVAAGWGIVTDCKENGAEALLTKATIAYLKQATDGPNPRPFFIGMGHHR